MRKYLIILAVLATPHMVIQAYQTRGCFALGSEWLLVLPVILSIALANQIKSLYVECFKAEIENESADNN